MPPGNGVLGVAGPEVLSHSCPDGVDGAGEAAPAAGEFGVTDVPGLGLLVVVGVAVPSLVAGDGDVDGVVVDALGFVVVGVVDGLGAVVVAGSGVVVGVSVGVVESTGSVGSGDVDPSTATGGDASVAGASGCGVHEFAGASGTANLVEGGEAGRAVALGSRFSTLVLS